jgi:hypothetical protein
VLSSDRLNPQTSEPAHIGPIDRGIHSLIVRANEDMSNMGHAINFQHVRGRRSIDWHDRNFIFNLKAPAQL